MSTVKTEALASSPQAAPVSISANSLQAPGLTLRGIVVSQKDAPKVWEGKTTMWTEMGVSYGEGIVMWKVKHPDYEKGVRAPLPKLLSPVTVSVSYCATEKGNVTVQGPWA